MTYVLVSEVCHTLDGALLDSPFGVVVLVILENSDLKVACLVLLNDLGTVYLDFLHLESTADYIKIVSSVVLEIGVFGCGFPHSENVVLLNFPYVTFCQRFEC